MLYLIGIGIGDGKGISLDGAEALKGCDVIFLENYTNLVEKETAVELEKLAGKKVEVLSREEVEREKRILQSANERKTALLVSGDPLIATTHVSLVLSARKKGIQVKIIHAASIVSAAVGESGLQMYKFGKSVTLAKWEKGYEPKDAYFVIEENRKRGLHTLVFLDIKGDLQRGFANPLQNFENRSARFSNVGCMEAKEAIELLEEMERREKKRVIAGETPLVVLSSVGRKNQKISFGEIGKLKKTDLGHPPSILIFPAKLHFLEEEWLDYFKL